MEKQLDHVFNQWNYFRVSPRVALGAILSSSILLFLIQALLPSVFYIKLDPFSYLVFHNIAELFGVAVCISIFGVGWYSFNQSKDMHVLFLSSMFLGIGVLGFMHTLSFPDMPPFVTPNSADKCNQFWLAFRLYYSLAFLLSAFIYPNTRRIWLTRNSLLLSILVATALVSLTIIYYPSYLPLTFVEGTGLTNYKIFSEYFVILMLCASLLAYWRRFSKTRDRLLVYYVAALALSIVSEFWFTLYSSFADTYHVLGHLYEVGAFYIIYKGIFAKAIYHPYERLWEANRQLENDILERKRAEKALKDSEEKFRAIFENDYVIMLIIDPQTGAIEDASPAACSFYGYSLQTIKQKNIFEINFSSQDIVSVAMQRARTRQVELFDFRHRLSNGEIREVTVCSGPISINGKQLLFSVVTDVTDRARYEAELKASEQRYRLVVENSNDVIWTLDPTTLKFTFMSAGVESMFGYLPQEALLINPQKWLLPDWRPRMNELLKDLLSGEQQRVVLEGQVYHKDGSAIWCEIVGSLWTDEISGVTRIIGVSRDVTERKESEFRLQESEDRFRTAFLTSPDAVTISRLNESGEGFYVDVNIGFCELTGYRPEEVLGKSSSEINIWSNPDDKNRLLSALKREGQVTNLQVQFRLKDGSIRTGLVSARMISLMDKPHILTVTRDVEDWKRAEDSLRRSEERFSQVTEVVGEWIWEVDQNGLYRYCSSAVLEILGYLPEEIVDKRFFWEFLASREQETSGINPLEVFEKKQTFKGYVRDHIHKDGRVVIVETSGMPVFEENGTFAGYRGTNTDITQRVQASESLELLAAVVEHAAESIVVTDLTGTIKYVNPAFEHTCGYSEQEAIGANPRILKSGKQPDYFYAELWSTITKGEIWHGHFVNKKKDGSLFEEEATISPLKDASGQIANYVAVKRDVTREVLLQSQLVQAQKMEAIGTLAGGIAHDFNNILFAIIGYTEMAIDDQPPGSSSLRDLEQVLSAAKRAADMVKQILTFSRQTEPQRVLLDLTPIVKEGLKFLRGSIPSTIEIRQEIGSLIGKVEADPTQMHQVLMNLCSNAAQAMKETTGVMTVELAEITLHDPYSARHLALKPGRYVKLSVSDTGYGIPPENIDRIFEPYFTTKGIGEGTGLGLAVIHGIVSGHGGAITVYSIPGQGSTFSVFLPVAERDFECEGDLDSFAIPSGKERILFVDDEEILLEMGQTILERLGYRVVTFLDPFQALEAYRSDPRGFDLVLTDLMMPKMTGLVLTKQIKIINPDVPIILCTGFGHKFTTEEAEEIGFIGILSKPISKKDLALTVRKALDTKLKQGEPPIDRCS